MGSPSWFKDWKFSKQWTGAIVILILSIRDHCTSLPGIQHLENHWFTYLVYFHCCLLLVGWQIQSLLSILDISSIWNLFFSPVFFSMTQFFRIDSPICGIGWLSFQHWTYLFYQSCSELIFWERFSLTCSPGELIWSLPIVSHCWVCRLSLYQWSDSWVLLSAICIVIGLSLPVKYKHISN